MQKVWDYYSFKRKIFEKDFYESLENGYLEIELE